MNKCDISLYAIIDPERTRGRPLGDLVKSAADGGITLLQYRDKLSDTRSLISNAEIIKNALSSYSIPLLINDRVDVALAVEAEGVHVGQSDMAPADARRLLGADALIGLTIKSLENARAAPLDVIDYACIGGVFTTLSKDNPSNIGHAGMGAGCRPFSTSCTEPAGRCDCRKSTPTTWPQSSITALTGAAIISAIFMADDVTRATKQLKSIIESEMT